MNIKGDKLVWDHIERKGELETVGPSFESIKGKKRGRGVWGNVILHKKKGGESMADLKKDMGNKFWGGEKLRLSLRKGGGFWKERTLFGRGKEKKGVGGSRGSMYLPLEMRHPNWFKGGGPSK